MKIKQFGTLSVARVEEIEQKYNVSLPEAYKQFMKNCNGGVVQSDGTETVMIPELNQTIDLEIFFGVNVKEDAFNLDYWMGEYRAEIPSHSLLIGHDVLRGFILLLCEDGGSRVCYWDDSFNFSASSETSNAYIIAQSFDKLQETVCGLNAIDIAIKGVHEMNYINYIPLGSIVLLKGGSQKLLVIARALTVKNGGKTFFFDYGAVLYPDGLTGDQMAYFNHQDISKVVFEGYSDVDNENVVENINRYLSENPNINRGSAESWNT